jgi:predicted HTH transcriptional regulator
MEQFLIYIFVGVFAIWLGRKIMMNFIDGEKFDDRVKTVQKAIEIKKAEKKERIVAYIIDNGDITNNEVEKLVDVADSTATLYLQELEDEGKTKQKGAGRGTNYTLK